MKMMLGAVAASLALLASGCATESYVKQQTDPLADRLSKLEARAGNLESQQSAQAADIQGMKKDMAADVQRCEAAASKAEAASANAQMSAEKCEKAFQLHLKK